MQRVACGIYCLSHSDIRSSSALDIIATKAKAFSKRIFGNSHTDMSHQGNSNEFFTDGCRSSFNSPFGRLYFRPLSQKKAEALFQEQNKCQNVNAPRKASAAEKRDCTPIAPFAHPEGTAIDADTLSWLLILTKQLLEKFATINTSEQKTKNNTVRRKFVYLRHAHRLRAKQRIYAPRAGLRSKRVI